MSGGGPASGRRKPRGAAAFHATDRGTTVGMGRHHRAQSRRWWTWIAIPNRETFHQILTATAAELTVQRLLALHRAKQRPYEHGPARGRNILVVPRAAPYLTKSPKP
jgi:hypothetical protein